MLSEKQLREKINNKLPGSVISDFVPGDFTAMVFRDRDYPDGDDVCKMLLRAAASFNLKTGARTLFCVLTHAGEVYSLLPLSESAGILYSKEAELII
ncbi:MAG: hypothetical protein J5921_02850 [Clostridia bacterium]|nr:hypothetical protein [Clostridia bacterium]